jgi:CheY-like chemotaxis protein
VVKESLKLIRSSIPKNIEIRQHIGDGVDTVLGNTTQINQLIINLCSNAADAMLPEGGTLTLELDNMVLDETRAGFHQSLTSGPHVKLVIADTGCGMAKETLAHIFEPYFTTKDIGKGTGIGLAVVHGIVEKHHGAIWAESKPGQGTVFTVLLPTCSGLIEDNSVEGHDLPWGTERIIFIDDEASIMQVGRRRLERLGYRVKGTTDPRQALAILQADPHAYDLVVTDMAMPHMTGEELAIRLIRLRPALPIILCTGFSEAISEQRAHEIGISVFLMKPVNWAEFAVAVRNILDAAKGGA